MATQQRSCNTATTKERTLLRESVLSGVSGHVPVIAERSRTFTGQLRHADGLKVHPPAAGVKHKKWAVCTTIHAPTQAILDFVKQEDDWAIVIVGDEGMAPFHVTGSMTFFLDADAQKALGQQYKELFQLLPWKHFGRKNVGYLYAIMHGAEMIWDFDDDNYLKGDVFPAIPDSSTVQEVVLESDCSAFNPLPLMGAPTEPTPMWPRGFPLSLIRSPCNHTLTQGDSSRIGVFQSLADNEPDVDGIYRLTRITPMNFDKDAGGDTSYALPKGTLSPYNAQATLVTKPALWSLLLPVTVHGRISDIWRSYIAQRLLWDVGLQIAFTPPVVDQLRNAHNHLADMQAEQPLYFQSLALVNYLRTWKGTATTLAGRYEELMVGLYERGFIEVEDVYLAHEWVAALARVGYEMPPLSAKAAFVPPVAPSDLSCPTKTRVLVTGIASSAPPNLPCPLTELSY